jgi:hypothetical protein
LGRPRGGPAARWAASATSAANAANADAANAANADAANAANAAGAAALGLEEDFESETINDIVTVPSTRDTCVERAGQLAHAGRTHCARVRWANPLRAAPGSLSSSSRHASQLAQGPVLGSASISTD